MARVDIFRVKLHGFTDQLSWNIGPQGLRSVVFMPSIADPNVAAEEEADLAIKAVEAVAQEVEGTN